MDRMTRTALTVQTVVAAHVAGAFDRIRSEKGQGSVEYAGIVLIVAALVAFAATQSASMDIFTGPIKTAVSAAFSKLGG